MHASTAMFLTLLAAAFGFILSIYLSTWNAFTVMAIIAMGGCIIYTINKNFEQLFKNMKQFKEKENEKDSIPDNTDHE